MFFSYDDKSVRFTGRWGFQDQKAINVTPGAYFEFAFKGCLAKLRFDISNCINPFPRLYISVDDSAMIETPVDTFIRITTCENTNHVVKVIFKSAVEVQERWAYPPVAAVMFCGYDAEIAGELPCDNRKTMEFIGDSITEGILIDELIKVFDEYFSNAIYSNDATGTYAFKLAKLLNVRPYIMGFGCLGITRGGNGNVPKIIESYPYNFKNSPVTYDSPDYILINHGANDRNNSEENYINGYAAFLPMVRALHKNSKIIVVSAYCNAHAVALGKFIASYNQTNREDILFINATDWVPLEPLHPLRDGHTKIVENLYGLLKDII